jgi:hypothetical protein
MGLLTAIFIALVTQKKSNKAQNWDQCDFLNIFVKKFSKKIGAF